MAERRERRPPRPLCTAALRAQQQVRPEAPPLLTIIIIPALPASRTPLRPLRRSKATPPRHSRRRPARAARRSQLRQQAILSSKLTPRQPPRLAGRRQRTQSPKEARAGPSPTPARRPTLSRPPF